MEEPDIYKHVQKVVKKYGFKKENFRIFYLANVIELTVDRVIQLETKNLYLILLL
jgi:hypothetical protein